MFFKSLTVFVGLCFVIVGSRTEKILPPLDLPTFGICQAYTGKICEQYLKDAYVFVPPNKTVEALEYEISSVFNVFRESKDMTTDCGKYALISMCFIKLPVCRQPDFLNSQYFAQLAKVLHHNYRLKFLGQVQRNATRKSDEVDFRKLMHKSNFNLLCRSDCNLLENEFCEKEFAIGKRHPIIGQMFLNFKSCEDLLEDEEETSGNETNLEDTSDCLAIGVTRDNNVRAKSTDTCYWNDGTTYQGVHRKTISGRVCEYWTKSLFKEIHQYPDLIGTNYCRNPKTLMDKPWCYTKHESEEKFIIEICDIENCLTEIYFYFILCLLVLATSILVILFIYQLVHRKTKSKTNLIEQPDNEMGAKKVVEGEKQHQELFKVAETTSSTLDKVVFSEKQLLSEAMCMEEKKPEKNRNIPVYDLNAINFIELLGEGTFGQVFKGEVRSLETHDRIYVAIKTLKESASEKQRLDFKHEIELISDLKHKNIVNILGIGVDLKTNSPILMLFEYMRNGDLHEYLIKLKSKGELTQLEFLMIFMEISSGMEYLSNHHYVHRDLAARNCLVADDNYTIKISDFGLSRDIYSSDYYRVKSKTLLPIRWMPSEAILYGKFTTESDIWSFGVCMWEIYTYGEQPYSGFSNPEVINMIRKRQLLCCPENCPTQVYSLMVECWHEQAVRRPSFSEINYRLKVIQQHIKKSELSASQNSSMFSIATNSTNNNLSVAGRDYEGNNEEMVHDADEANSQKVHTKRHHHRQHKNHHRHHHHHHHHPPGRTSSRSSQNSLNKIQNTMILP